jgi:hypothetical protein
MQPPAPSGNRVRLRLALRLALLLPLLAAPAGGAPSADEVLACVRRNAPEAALVQTVELAKVDRAGKERAYAAKLYGKRGADGRGRVLLRVEEPSDLRGTALLLIQKERGTEMFVYLPELEKVRRITARHLRGKLAGTDFTYEALERLFGYATQADVELLPDVERDGRPAWVLRAAPPPEKGSSFARIVSYVDRATCVPLEIAFYEKGGAPAKVLSVDPARITKEGSIHVPRLVRMRDLARETESRIETHAIELDPELPDALFTREALEKGAE